MKILLIGLVASLTAYAGYAAAAPVSATLKAPVAKHTQFVRGETAWVCDQTQCTVTVGTVDTDGWMACRDLMRTVGAVASYGTLDAKGIAKCNGEPAPK